MAVNTVNFQFIKPDENDYYSIFDQNDNWDKADALFKAMNLVDGGKFIESDDQELAIAVHNASRAAHENMAVDGGAAAIDEEQITLQEHLTNKNAHPNLILDGNT